MAPGWRFKVNREQELQRRGFRKIIDGMRPNLDHKNIWKNRDKALEKRYKEIDYFVEKDLDIPLIMGAKKVFGPGSRCVR